MKLLKVVFAISCGLIVAGCGDESAAQKAVKASLNDPDSAKFGKFTSTKKADSQKACLTVNAKNSMGGYTGDQQAALMKTEGEWQVISIIGIDHAGCVGVISKE